MTRRAELVGRVWVDSGLLMLGDPAYTLPDSADERTAVARDWPAFCDKVETGMKRDVVFPFTLDGLGLVVNPGDGVFPVYVTRDRSGGIASLSVVFDGGVR